MFLVDFEREKKRRSHGAAASFLKANQDVQFCITFTIVGELAAGQSLGSDRAKWAAFIQSFRILESSQQVAWQFGAPFRYLQAQGNLIAATGLAHDLPVVTRNARDFERIPQLKVLRY